MHFDRVRYLSVSQGIGDDKIYIYIWEIRSPFIRRCSLDRSRSITMRSRRSELEFFFCSFFETIIGRGLIAFLGLRFSLDARSGSRA